MQGVFQGKHQFGRSFTRWPCIEDDWASTSEPGISNFVRSSLKPQEAQGRGFSHGHGKHIGVPQERCARLKEIFVADATENESDALDQVLQHMREAVINAASTLQYDSAVLPARQVGVDVPPEPFTERQQRQSRFDGGVEEDGHARELVPVTGAPRLGHLVREELAAVSAQRPLRDAYKAVPLTGAQQSMLPSYRLARRFIIIITIIIKSSSSSW